MLGGRSGDTSTEQAPSTERRQRPGLAMRATASDTPNEVPAWTTGDARVLERY